MSRHHPIPALPRRTDGTKAGIRQVLALVMALLFGTFVWGAPLAAARITVEAGTVGHLMDMSHQGDCGGCCELAPQQCPALCAPMCLSAMSRFSEAAEPWYTRIGWDEPPADHGVGREVEVEEPPPKG